MTLEVVTFVNGKSHQNCYIVGATSGEALIIDPGSEAEELSAIIDGRGWRPCAILNTHGHYDHVGAVEDLRLRYGVPFYLHVADESLMKRANLYRLFFESAEMIRIPKATEPLSGDVVLSIPPFSITCLATPGHTPGSMCFQVEAYLFSGDTLLCGAVGRTDLPGGDRERLAASLRKLKSLPGELIVCGGHGPQTVLREEFLVDRAAGKLAHESPN